MTCQNCRIWGGAQPGKVEVAFPAADERGVAKCSMALFFLHQFG
ncbi:hypothetical protein PSE_4349 [Pseudovibrio sp. FO-BEG1]|nr:hypothetical protein PSE_4349 [Pseudovibrio sp. FO-BEG1]